MNSSDQKPRGFFYRLFSGIGTIITFIRNTFMNIIFLFIVIAIFAAIGSNTSKPLPGKFALRVAPSGVLVDQRNYMDTASMLFDEDKEDAETLVRDVVDAINYAADDKRVSSMVLDLNHLQGGGITKMEEIGQAILKFKEKKKEVIAISDNYSQDQYYLAASLMKFIYTQWAKSNSPVLVATLPTTKLRWKSSA